MSESLMTIGELAQRTGVATSALRYWEDVGLLTEPARVAGQRRYPESALTTVGLILLLHDAGYSLAEQKTFLAADSTPEQRRTLERRKLAQLDEQIGRAVAAREAIEHSLRCPHTDVERCPSFQALVAARLAGQSLQQAHADHHTP